MKNLKPITIDYIRRFSILILLALFAWIYVYAPLDIYEIQVKNYVGAGMISMSASPEIGMEITLKSGKKVKVMANYLEADEVFTQRFQALEERVEGRGEQC